jgi:hypothetical protein
MYNDRLRRLVGWRMTSPDVTVVTAVWLEFMGRARGPGPAGLLLFKLAQFAAISDPGEILLT